MIRILAEQKNLLRPRQLDWCPNGGWLIERGEGMGERGWWGRDFHTLVPSGHKAHFQEKGLNYVFSDCKDNSTETFLELRKYQRMTTNIWQRCHNQLCSSSNNGPVKVGAYASYLTWIGEIWQHIYNLKNVENETRNENPKLDNNRYKFWAQSIFIVSYITVMMPEISCRP